MPVCEVAYAEIGFNFATFNEWQFPQSLVASGDAGSFFLTGPDTLFLALSAGRPSAVPPYLL
jgi:hypothetical protein